MSGFWAGSIPQWAWVTGGCLLAFCLIIGFLAGAWWMARYSDDGDYDDVWPPEVHHDPLAISYRPRDRRDPEAAARREAMARRTHPVYRQRPVDLSPGAFIVAGPSWPEPEGDDRDDPPPPPPPPPPPDEPGLTRQDRALLGLDQPETEEEAIAHFAAVADEIIAWAHAAAAPYPGGDQ